MLKHKILAFILAVLTAIVFIGCGKQETPVQTPSLALLDGADLSNDYVKWEGRYEYIESGIFDLPQVALYFTATGFTVEFYGTELKARFVHIYNSLTRGNDIYYNVAVDDEVLPSPNPERTILLPDKETDKTVTLVSGLNKGRHTVKCLKMVEAADAYTAVVSLETDGGFYKRDKNKDMARTKFMVVCASNGSGFGSLYYNEKHSVSRTTANSSSLHGFMYLSARMFDADVQFVAQAGWGLACKPDKQMAKVLDYTGITTSNNVQGAQKTALWDYSKWVPDVILFHIGGNDTDSEAFDVNVYQQTVVETVTKLHGLYPDAKMLWVYSTSTKCGTYAMSALNNAGINGYIRECIIPRINDYGYGAGSHASLYMHIVASDNIATTLEQNFGMSRELPNVTFEDYASIIQG